MLTIIFAILSVIQLLELIYDVANRKSVNYIQDVIWLILGICLTVGYFYSTKYIGIAKIEEDDERDKFIQTKTNNQAFNILQWVLFVLGAVTIIIDVNLGQMGLDSRAMVIIVVGVVLIFLWAFSWILQLILMIINYFCN